ncbi:MAG: hypothetical protein CSYNP_00785 [Syntrophus sp. SKADARSKE-3]|nr:hypothetical protein [Syntrophus sp. SKADARSKE-3]
MRIIKPDNLSLLFTPVMVGEALCLSAGTMAFFSLDPGAPERLLPEAGMWQTIATVLEKDEVFDMGYPKPRGEYLVYGSCRPGRPERAAQVQVEVAGCRKQLHITGNRKWLVTGFPEDPQPFTEMKVSYQQAFGGPGYELNPLGKGLIADAEGYRELPNVQDRNKLLASDSDLPAPAGFTAYPMIWPQRAKYLGRFDDAWRETRWPYYPLDTEAEFFNTAPEDQRLAGFFRGNETIRIVNMHPDKREIVSVLPALRPRVFLNQAVPVGNEKDKQEFREIKMHGETVWLFPDLDVGIILYRGVMTVYDEELDDCLHLMANWESMEEAPVSVEDYHELFLATVNPVEAEAAPPATPEIKALATAALPPLSAPPAGLSPGMEALSSEIAALEAKTETHIRELGTTREQLLERYLPKQVPENPLSREELKKSIAALEENTAARLKELGISKDELIKKYIPNTAPEPPDRPEGFLKEIAALEEKTRAQIGKLGVTGEELIKRHAPADYWKEAPLGPSDLAALLAAKEAEAPAAEAIPADSAPPPEPPPVARPLTRDDVLERYRQGESLAHLDLSGLDFSGEELSRADFSGAILEKTIFTKATLVDTDFSEAIISEADFREAALTGSRFCGATGTAADFAKAVLTGCDLSAGDFTGADFTATDLTQATLNRGIFEKVIMKEVKGKGLKALKADFAYADLGDAHFTDGDFRDADFSYAGISHIDLTGANATGLRLHGATGTKAIFRGACLRESRADKDTDLKGADFALADLTFSSWGGVKLTDALMEQAIMDKADFSKARFSHVRMVNAQAKETTFMKAHLTDSDMRGINLFKGSLRKAVITDVDIRHSNLYGVDLYGARIKKTDLREANIKMTLLASAGGE